jgi:hypothetical protein
MIEAKDRAMQFKTELKALLKKYNTEIEITDEGTLYVPETKMEVYIPSVWDGDNCIAESAVVDLGSRIDGD